MSDLQPGFMYGVWTCVVVLLLTALRERAKRR